jgi:hypothetical protein
MKYLYPLVFVAAGILFLLISTVFYAPITTFLLSRQPAESPLPWWDLEWVLKAVRVIFFMVGVFFTCFALAFHWIKQSLV